MLSRMLVTFSDCFVTDCVDVYNSLAAGGRNDGIYEIWPDTADKPFRVYCTFDSEGLWTEIHRREDGGTNFQVGLLDTSRVSNLFEIFANFGVNYQVSLE